MHEYIRVFGLAKRRVPRFIRVWSIFMPSNMMQKGQTLQGRSLSEIK